MLLEGYRVKIFRGVQSSVFIAALHCTTGPGCGLRFALSKYRSGGDQYLSDPPEVMFHHHGTIIKVAAREIAIKALKDENEAERILAWLKDEINRVWEDRERISPSREGRQKPKLINILQLLPKTNCKKCGQPTWSKEAEVLQIARNWMMISASHWKIIYPNSYLIDCILLNGFQK